MQGSRTLIWGVGERALALRERSADSALVSLLDCVVQPLLSSIRFLCICSHSHAGNPAYR
jgi:hypothetical protein